MEQKEFDMKLIQLLDMPPDNPEHKSLKQELQEQAKNDPTLMSVAGENRSTDDIEEIIDCFAEADPSTVSQESVDRYRKWLRTKFPEHP